MDFVQFARDNWAVIAQAPWVFAAMVVLIGGSGLLIGRYWLSERVANLESRLQLKDDRIREYERTLEGATPDDVLRTIADLERRLEALGDPRVLSQDQIDKMGNLLRGRAGEIFISRDNDSADSAKVYTQMKRLFKSEGWKVTGGAVWDIENPPECGLTLLTRTGDDRSPQELAVVEALSAAGVAFERRREPPKEDQPALQLNFSEMD